MPPFFVLAFAARFDVVVGIVLPSVASGFAFGGLPGCRSPMSAKSESWIMYARPNRCAGNRPSRMNTLTRVRCTPSRSAASVAVNNFMRNLIQKTSTLVYSSLDYLSAIVCSSFRRQHRDDEGTSRR